MNGTSKVVHTGLSFVASPITKRKEIISQPVLDVGIKFSNGAIDETLGDTNK
jgi:hypothetical protein